MEKSESYPEFFSNSGYEDRRTDTTIGQIENNCERELRREREQRESAREREGGKDGVVAK